MDKTLWTRKNYYGNRKLSSEQREFLTTCMVENLNHARHVENERITFNSIYMAVVAGSLAFIFSMQHSWLPAILSLALIVLGLVAMLLTRRWNNTFKRHLTFAKMNYLMLHEDLFPEAADEDYDNKDLEDLDEREMIPGLNELPAYCFSPRDPETKSEIGHWIMKNLRTQLLFDLFYGLIEVVLLGSFLYFVHDMLG